jgi:hypothetical protein
VNSFINFITHSYNTVDSNFYMWIKRRMHLEKLRETQNRERNSDTELLKKHRDQFCDWYRVYVRFMLYMLIYEK